MRVPVEKRKELSQAVSSLLGDIRREKGCVRCDFFRGMEDENMLCLVQEWEAREDFDDHLQSRYFKVLRGAMSLLDEPGDVFAYSCLPHVAPEEIDRLQSCDHEEENDEGKAWSVL